MNGSSAVQRQPDLTLLLLGVALLLVGLIAISSASIEYAAVQTGNPWHHTRRHLVYIVLAVLVGLAVYSRPLEFWMRTSWVWLFPALGLLILVLIPGIGVRANGAQRWLPVAGITLQPSELAKMAMIIYLAGYVVRREHEVRNAWRGFLTPMYVLFAVTLLLMFEPDFGATVIVTATTFGMLFLAGVKLGQFLLVLFGAIAALALALVLEPYRIDRLTGHLRAWDDPFDKGFQLTQSLIAFGRGEWTGVGLGNSVQKLFYLPEAHTDFVFSIWVEETGFVGALAVIGLYVALIGRIMWTGRRAALAQQPFGAYICYGVALVFAGQAFVNMGVSAGLLPTKGLTLPFISYGGTSLLVCCAMFALVLRVERETEMSTKTNSKNKGKSRNRSRNTEKTGSADA